MIKVVRFLHPAIPVAVVAVLLVLAGIAAWPARHDEDPGGPVSIVLVGDISLGRGVAPIAAGDPEGLFEGVRRVVRNADLAMGNLESPLSTRPHISQNPHVLVADPATAELVAAAGFDVMSLANNHAGDAGPESVLDTIAAVEAAGMTSVGGGADETTAAEPLVVDVSGVRVAVVAFDATRAGLRAGPEPGIVHWEPETARNLVLAAATRADLVIASVHGGVEYLPEADPRMIAIAEQLVDWGVDVVWGHGPHVVQPVTSIPSTGGRTAVVATSLGNFLMDQRGPATGHGAVLEVLADRTGVLAFRVGATSHLDLRVRFDGWELPGGDAALLDGEWWELVRAPVLSPTQPTPVDEFAEGTVVAAGTGRLTGDGPDLVVSFRRPSRPHPVRDGLPGVRWADGDGMTAHLGIYQTEDLEPVWVAGMVPGPVAALAVCDGAVALAYSTLDDPAVIATGGARWRDFGLFASVRLPGEGLPACADVDGDGTTEPVIVDRRAVAGSVEVDRTSGEEGGSR
jgi:poly-gamma-glutamate capsule biosynthesis protein CapA/YwtB (metallophosphatase superfamily)